ncbi:hypothetical protein Tco_0320771 [Tanacetum coccineum]
MFDIDYLTDSMNYIHVSLENQTNPHAGTSELTNSAGTLQTPNANASEEEDEAEELIDVPTSVRHTLSKVGPRKSSTNSKAAEFLTELQTFKTQENEAYSTGISEDTPEILAFRRELDELAPKHLREFGDRTKADEGDHGKSNCEIGEEGKEDGRWEADISPEGLEAAETLAKVLTQRTKTYTRKVKTGLMRKLDADEVSTGEEINTGFTDVSTAFTDVNTAFEEIKTGDESIIPSLKKGQRKGKAMLEEKSQSKRTKTQIIEEQTSLAEIARLQAQEEAEDARKAELQRQDALIAKRMQDEFM